MIKLYLTWFFYACLSAIGQAQSVAIADALSDRPSQKDTLRAIHRLFQTRRQGTTANTFVGLLEVGASVALVRALATLTTLPAGGKPDGGAVVGASLTVGLPGLILAGVGVGKGIRFSHKKEVALVASYRQGQSLPKSIRRRLRAKHFR